MATSCPGSGAGRRPAFAADQAGHGQPADQIALHGVPDYAHQDLMPLKKREDVKLSAHRAGLAGCAPGYPGLVEG